MLLAHPNCNAQMTSSQLLPLIDFFTTLKNANYYLQFNPSTIATNLWVLLFATLARHKLSLLRTSTILVWLQMENFTHWPHYSLPSFSLWLIMTEVIYNLKFLRSNVYKTFFVWIFRIFLKPCDLLNSSNHNSTSYKLSCHRGLLLLTELKEIIVTPIKLIFCIKRIISSFPCKEYLC